MIESTTYYNGHPVKLVWHPLNNLEGMAPIVQVYGLCFTQDGQVLIIRNPLKAGTFTPWYLPGGTTEKGEKPEETLNREIREEADIEITNLKLLGAQEVFYPNNPNKEKGDHYYQVRYFALISKTNPQTIDPHDGGIVELKYIDPKDFTKYVEWGEIGQELINLATKEFKKLVL
ncbi:NUDIX domain-containing protein [Candidatus Nomurabacteria bacterium]|uniref:NUDIX domain-containing protein n=1 Tax=candidate division WWE3 bacterium TaxID=2053526 RepID=A0A955IW07_UNCKA|nr:NUDIX domain-containing protein [candidate division WWE3 bacterium]MCB9823420.1 NUDIX domain-containing protein [Candidatus Nomurabacteria bacterium]MCB9827702.1 NUDIX domain-containing protein [Candidatus Nomurabacteria bacterium]HXK52834.1 NUDIX domain-containing protein [bacterium]